MDKIVYLFGRKVSVIQSRDTTNDAVFYNTKTLTLKDDLRTYYNWDEESQINPFIARCHGVSVKDTLKSAGINISDPIYAVGRIEEKTYHGNQWESYRYYVIIGTLIDINTNSVNKDVHLRRFKGDGEYNQQPTRYDSYMNAKLQDVVKFCLY